MNSPIRHAARRLSNAVAAIIIGVSVPLSGLLAQAICSAPHSSPTLAGGGSIGTLPIGTGWWMVSGLHQRSKNIFNSQGDRQPLLAGGRFRTASLYLSGGMGLMRGVDIWGQAPVHSMRYVDTGGERTRSGIGDARLALRLSPDLVGSTVPIALRLGMKHPGTKFPLDATVIPLTEGQRDFEVSVETGRMFGGGVVYLLGWSGYRWRQENVEAARKPGNEGFFHVAAGTSLGGVRFELGTDVLLGQPPRRLGFEVAASRRRLVQIAPTITRKMGVGDLEVTSVIPIVGRNLPTGAGLSVGYRVGWGGGPKLSSGGTAPNEHAIPCN